MVDFDDLQKSPREKSWDYLQWIKTLPCVICSHHSEPHHLDTTASWGSDYSAVPLCRTHHSEWHNLGLRKFEDKYYTNLWRWAWKLLKEWHESEGPKGGV